MRPAQYIRFTGRPLASRPLIPEVLRCHLSQSQRSLWPKKESQDRDSINTESTEYTKSSTDESVAHTDVAFDPTKRSPEDEKSQADKEKKGSVNPLEVSPANQDLSKPKTGPESSSTKPQEKTRRSGLHKKNADNNR